VVGSDVDPPVDRLVVLVVYIAVLPAAAVGAGPRRGHRLDRGEAGATGTVTTMNLRLTGISTIPSSRERRYQWGQVGLRRRAGWIDPKAEVAAWLINGTYEPTLHPVHHRGAGRLPAGNLGWGDRGHRRRRNRELGDSYRCPPSPRC
jgi:hypothetical protein